jgi:ubiquitin C-terminal hydrolase
MIESLSLEEISKIDQETYVDIKKPLRRQTIHHLDKHSYRLVGVVSHLGQSSNSGHYISDVLNIKTNTWSSYDDLKVEKETEDDVITRRSSTGYIFFYMFNSPFEKLNN